VSRAGDRFLGDRRAVSGAQPAKLNAAGVTPGWLLVEYVVALRPVDLGGLLAGLGALALQT